MSPTWQAERQLATAGIEPDEIDVWSSLTATQTISAATSIGWPPGLPNARLCHVPQRVGTIGPTRPSLAGLGPVLRGVGPGEPAAAWGTRWSCFGGETRDRPGILAIGRPCTPRAIWRSPFAPGAKSSCTSPMRRCIDPPGASGWYPVVDYDPGVGSRDQGRLFDRAASDRSWYSAFHFPPFPSRWACHETWLLSGGGNSGRRSPLLTGIVAPGRRGGSARGRRTRRVSCPPAAC